MEPEDKTRVETEDKTKDETTNETEDRTRVETDDKTRAETEDITRNETEDKVRNETDAKARVETEDKTNMETEDKTIMGPQDKTREENEDKTNVATEDKTIMGPQDKTREENEDKTNVATEDKTIMRPQDKTRVETEDKTKMETEDKTIMGPQDKTREESEDKTNVATEDKARLESEDKKRVGTEDKRMNETKDKTTNETVAKRRVETENKTRDETKDKTMDETEDKPRDKAEDKTRNETGDKTSEETEDSTRVETKDKTMVETEDKTRMETELAMSLERCCIKLGLSSVFEWSNWRYNELHTKRTLNTIQKETNRFKSEYINVTEAFDTITAFLQSALPEKRFQRSNTYRIILKKNPKHINALIDMFDANLASMSEKQKHATAFTKDLTDQERKFIIGKACLELGMALVEVEQIIDFEHTYTQIDRNMSVRQNLEGPVQCLQEIDPRLINHLQFESENELELPMADTYATLFTSTQTSIMRDREIEAVIYLSEGLTRIGADLSEDELLIWKYFLARAYTLLVFKSHKIGFEMHLHNEWRIKAIKLFNDVIHGSDSGLNDDKTEILKTNKARSYTNIGEILHQIPKREDYLSCLQYVEMSPILAFETAKSIRPDDSFVLVHYGNYLVYNTQGVKKGSDLEQSNIETALDMLSAALKQDEGHWFAHSLQITALKKLYTITTRNNSQPGITLLEDAIKDGEFCLSSLQKMDNMLEFSRILHWRADPTKGKISSKIDYDGLQEAIDVLITVDLKFPHHNSALVYKERATCHFIKGEVEEALIYIELAFYTTTKVKVSVSFVKFCNYFIDVIEGKRLENPHQCAFALRRLKTAMATLLETYRAQVKLLKSNLPQPDDETMNILEQYLETRIKYMNKPTDKTTKSIKSSVNDDKSTNSIKKFVNDILHFLDSKIKSIINDNNKSVAAHNPNLPELVESNQNFVKSVFGCKVLESVFEKIDSLSKYIDHPTPVGSLTLDAEKLFVSPGTYIPSPSKHRQPYNQVGKRYDFFILHSDEDNDWVVCCLLQQLEYGLYGFKGCVQERDFEAGKTILRNIEDKINNSNKILIVISRNTPNAFFEYLEKLQILKCLYVTGEHYRDTYVLNVGVEERPKQLIHFPYIKCGPLPLDLNDVRNMLALPRPNKPPERPRVYIQPIETVYIQPIEEEHDRQINIISAKCTVDEDRKITASNILELGIPQVPIYETVHQVEGAASIFEYGFPESNVLILYERHVVCFDVQKRLAKWVAYKLEKDDIQGPGNRDDCRFQSDPRLPETMQPSGSAFKAESIIRGHMAVAGDLKISQGAMHDTFKFTNIYPEYQGNKMWLAIEVYIREKVLKDFQEVRIFIIPAFSKDGDPHVAYSTVGIAGRGVAVPKYMFKFVIAISESGGGTLVTGAFRVPNTKDYGCKELSGGNNAFKHILDYEVKTNIKTIETDTGFQFRKMLNGHKYNEELLEQCHFITADYLKEYEEEKKEKRKEKRKAEKTNRKQK